MRKRPLLAFLAATSTRPATTFVPLIPTSIQQGHAPSSRRHRPHVHDVSIPSGRTSLLPGAGTTDTALSVSRKNKEGRATLAAAEERQQTKLRSELEHSLRRLQRNNAVGGGLAKTKPSAVARSIKKLLHDADHDALDDIGDEARILAAVAYAAVGRNGDAARLLAAVTDPTILAERPEAAYAGLVANVGEEGWERAADFAAMLFDGDQLRLRLRFDAEDGDGEGDGGARMEMKARRMAVLAYAHAGRRENLDDAVMLLKSSGDEETTMTASEYSAVLGALLRSERPREARELYIHALALPGGDTSSAEVSRVGLSIAKVLGDVSLAADAFGRLGPKPAAGDIVTALQSFQDICAASAEHVAFARELVDALAKTNKKPVRIDDVDLVGEVFSFLLLDDERGDTLDLIETSKLIRVKADWPNWLRKDSRAAILPILLESKRVEDAMEIFHSLDITTDCLSEYAGMSSDFWSAVLRLCYEKPRSDVGREVGSAILSQGHPLNDDIDTLAARVHFIWERSFNKGEISASEAQEEIDSLLSLTSSAQNNGASYSHLVVEGTASLMWIDGKEANIDRLNERFFAAMDSSMYELSDLEIFQLRKHRYFALALAWEKKDEVRFFSLLFPEGDFGPRRVADVPILGGLTKAENLLNAFESFVSKKSGAHELALQEVTEQAYLCDEASGNSNCMDEFVEEYHELLKSLWRNPHYFLEYFSCQFPSIPSKAPLNPTKLDKIKEMLWGEQCRTMFLDLMKDGKCEEGWMRQADSGSFGLLSFDDVIQGWYQSPVFEYEKIKDAYREARKNSVKRIVGLLFDKELSKAKDVENLATSREGKKKKRAYRQANDLTTWTLAAKSFYLNVLPSLGANLLFGNKNLESNASEALECALDVVLKHPSVRFLKVEKKKSILLDIIKNEADPSNMGIAGKVGLALGKTWGKSLFDLE